MLGMVLETVLIFVVCFQKISTAVPNLVLKLQIFSNICIDLFEKRAIMTIVKNKRSQNVRQRFTSEKKGSFNMFWLETTILTIALALVLVGIWHEEKLIAFEDKIWDVVADRLGYIAARIVIAFRKKKAVKLRAERNARAEKVAAARRSRMHIVKDCASANDSTKAAYIA